MTEDLFIVEAWEVPRVGGEAFRIANGSQGDCFEPERFAPYGLAEERRYSKSSWGE